jgi:enediyne polyketide synthase
MKSYRPDLFTHTLIVHGATEEPIAAALRDVVTAHGGSVQMVGFLDPALGGTVPPESFSSLIAILPRQASPLTDEVIRLRGMIERFQFVIALAVRRSAAVPNLRVTFVQFGGGRCGTGPEPADPESCCAAALARTFHLERPMLRVRVIDLASLLAPDRIAALVAEELSAQESAPVVGYTGEGRRLVPRARLQQPAEYRARELDWTADDVILVTGGGKGITAECALALGRATKARLALVGSSPSPENLAGDAGELAKNLARFEAEGVAYRYIPCDLTRPDAVRALVERVRRELGPITAVVHGAGVNRFGRLGEADTEAVLAEVGPKLLGAHYLFAALAEAPPRLFVALTSIIGVTGMPGNGWYAFANEALDLVLRRFEARQGTAVLAVAFSIWGETGMGMRTGSVERLRRRGIEAIPTAEGVRRFLRLFHNDPGHRQIVVTARLAGLDTWPTPPSPAPAELRFIERIIGGHPGVELIARTRLCQERDRFLEDHVLNGSALFPTVFGLEAMAQATAVLTGETEPPIVRMEDIRLERPIVVAESKGIEIEIRACVAEAEAGGERHVRVGIRTEQTGFAVDHFSATVVLGTPRPGPHVPVPNETHALPIEPRTELYGSLLFQGPRFQKIERLLELDNEHAILESHSEEQARGEEWEGRFLLGDPYFHDTLLQAGQLTIPRQFCLPVRIERIEFFGRASQRQGRQFVFAPFKTRHGNEYEAEIFATDKHGQVLEKICGYWLRILSERPECPSAADLAQIEARDEQLLQTALAETLPPGVLPQFGVALGRMPRAHALSREERRRQAQPIFARALRARPGWVADRNEPAVLSWLSSGQPRVEHARETGVSIAHDDLTCLCVVGTGRIGCDWMPISARSRADWNALLHDSRMALLDQLIASGDLIDVAGARIWAALEAVRKATQSVDIRLSLSHRRQGGVFLRADNLPGALLVWTQPVVLTCPPRRMLAMTGDDLGREGERLAQPQQERAPGINPAWHCVSVADDGPQGQPVQQMRFAVSFQEASGLSRRVPAARYQGWMGKMRELVTSGQLPQLIEQIATGEWGLVTNWADVRILGEATANDVLQMRFWTLPARGGEVEFCCDFWKVGTEERFERVAFAQQKATWVRVVGHGRVVPEDLPSYLAEFIRRMGPRAERASPLPELPEPLNHLLCPTLASAKDRPGRPILQRDTIQTSPVDANLVGNVYFANYFAWQERLRDLFLFRVAPDVCRAAGHQGEWLCLHGRVDYLREAMPFDRIEVALSACSTDDSRAVLNFAYFKLSPNGGREKLAVGRQDVIWVRRDVNGRPEAAPLPSAVHQALAAGESVIPATARKGRRRVAQTIPAGE